MKKNSRIPTEKEIQKAREEGRTSGRKGYKALRINMAFTPEVHEYIKTMARGTGKSITQFTEEVFRKSIDENIDLYGAIKRFRDEMIADEKDLRILEIFQNTENTQAELCNPQIDGEPNLEIRYKTQPVEVKSKRVNLVMQPTIYETAMKNASAKGISLNEYIHRLVLDDTDLVKEYKRIKAMECL